MRSVCGGESAGQSGPAAEPPRAAGSVHRRGGSMRANAQARLFSANRRKRRDAKPEAKGRAGRLAPGSGDEEATPYVRSVTGPLCVRYCKERKY